MSFVKRFADEGGFQTPATEEPAIESFHCGRSGLDVDKLHVDISFL